MIDKKALVEAALFVSEDPLSLKKLSRISEIPTRELRGTIAQIKEDFDNASRGIELVLTGEGYQFQVKDKFLNKVSDLSSHSDLPGGVLRTLGLVALHQPMMQSDIVKIQGNKSYNYIKKLEKRNLITTEKVGRTKLIRTTKEFERYFGRNIKEIQDRLKIVVNDDNKFGIDVPDEENEGSGRVENTESQAL